jgi:hypothetical protein
MGTLSERQVILRSLHSVVHGRGSDAEIEAIPCRGNGAPSPATSFLIHPAETHSIEAT